jgi:CBS domain-containing protein
MMVVRRFTMTQTHRYNLPELSSIISKDIISFTSDHSLLDVLKVFNKERISFAPVVSSQNENQIIGVISDIDCIKAVTQKTFFDDFRNLSLSEIVNTTVLTVSVNSNLYDVEDFFQKHQLRYAPVVNAKNELVGIISRRDIMKAFEKIVDEMLDYKHNVKNPVVLTERELRRFNLSR